MRKKLNILLQKWPNGGIATAEWLESIGIYKQLRKKYVDSHWLESFGYGDLNVQVILYHGPVHSMPFKIKIKNLFILEGKRL